MGEESIPQDGREYYHELDDIKDWQAYIRPNLTFYIAPEQRINMEKWKEKLADRIKKYVGEYDLSSVEAIK